MIHLKILLESPMFRPQYPAFWVMMFVMLCVSATPRADDKAPTANPVISALAPATASAGQTVTLSGQNFGNTKGKIAFGKTVLENKAITLWNNNAAIATVPKGSGQVVVQLMTNKGKLSNKLNFTYSQNNSGGPGTGGLSNFKVLANNDLGMHCVDKDFSVFSILPPYNVVNAQVIGQDASGKPKLLDNNAVELRYSPIADANNSINSTSRYKTNFWKYALPLYGANLDPNGQGLKGLYMPDDTTDRSKTGFSWNSNLNLFSAEGIPILPIDDQGATNPYPMLRVSAFDKITGAELGFTDTVVPVSDETTCSNCHATGKKAATRTTIVWSTDTNPDIQSRINVLKLHDFKKGTDLLNNQPVLCASCHYSPALDLAGVGQPSGTQVGHQWMSTVMHDNHARKVLSVDGKTIYDSAAPVTGLDPALNGVPPADQQACYQCHPGANTKCLRGAMTETVTCQNCHGDMKAVGGTVAMKAYGAINNRADKLNRNAWSDEPRCQSCHTGDAVSHVIPSASIPAINATLANDNIRLIHAYDRNDPAASPLLAVNKRFAENDGKLFRYSKGHSNVSCEGCHGSTHAIWPGDSQHPNDNIAANDLQGHVGTVSECSVCHKAGSLPPTMSGPHGLHNIGDTNNPFVTNEDNGHPKFYKQNPAECQACHGIDGRGTVLSRAAADRSFKTEWGTKTVKKGEAISCWTCHNGPDDD